MNQRRPVYHMLILVGLLLLSNLARTQSVFVPDKTAIDHSIVEGTGETFLRYNLNESKDYQISWNSKWTLDQGIGKGWCHANQIEYLKNGWMRFNRCGSSSFDLIPEPKTMKRLQALQISSGEQLKNLSTKKKIGEELSFFGYTTFRTNNDLRTLIWSDEGIQVVGGNETLIRTIFDTSGRQTKLERWDRKSQKLVFETNFEYKPTAIIKIDPDSRVVLYLSGNKISDIEISMHKNQFAPITTSTMKYSTNGDLDSIERRTRQANKLTNDSIFDSYHFIYSSDNSIQLVQVHQTNSKKLLKFKFDNEKRVESVVYAYQSEKGERDGYTSDYQYVIADGNIIKFTAISVNTERQTETKKITTMKWADMPGLKVLDNLIYE